MADKVYLKKDGAVVAPVTTSDAVVDKATGNSIDEVMTTINSRYYNDALGNNADIQWSELKLSDHGNNTGISLYAGNKYTFTPIFSEGSTLQYSIYGIKESGSAIKLVGATLNTPSTITVEDNFTDFYIYYHTATTATSVDFKLSVSSSLDQEVSTIKEQVIELSNSLITETTLVTSSSSTENGFVRADGTESDSSSYSKSDYILIESANGKIRAVGNNAATSVAPVAFYDEDKNFISAFEYSEGAYDTIIDIPLNATYLKGSTVKSQLLNFSISTYQFAAAKLKNVYVSTQGNDENDGATLENAVATFDRAAQLGAENLFIDEGDYRSSINLSSFEKIIGINKVRFILPKLEIDSAELVSGQTKVYCVPYTSTISVPFLWQMDIEDEDTVIESSERHPYNRGHRTRLPHTRIYEASSVDEIASSDSLMWYKDDDADILYFSITEDSNLSNNPIVIPNSIGLSKDEKGVVNIENIEVHFAPLKLSQQSGIITNTIVGCTASNCFSYNYCVGLILKSCEAFGAGNDGFNGHNYDVTVSPRTQVTLEYCYSHDNYDDDESSHEYCEIVHRGGLYEYSNAGVTPASGCHTVCFSCIARNHGDYLWTNNSEGSGFSAQGSSSSEGNGTNIYCHNCLSRNNKIGFRSTYGADSLVMQCVSIDDTVAYYNITQISCITE